MATAERRYDLDWLRVIAFALLMLFHTGMMFSSWDWHIKDLETSEAFDVVIRFVHQWRMPLLFFISGSAIWFAMDRYSTRLYFLERQKRLLIPLIFGMLVIIPPQIYVERLYHHQQFDSFWDFYRTVFTTGSYPEGNLSWHHLWYVPYIWTYSMLTLPLCLALRSRDGRPLLDGLHKLLARTWCLFLIFIPAALSDILLRPYYPGDHHNLLDDWGNFSHKLTFFVAGFALASAGGVYDLLARQRRKFLLGGIIASLALQGLWFGWWHIPRSLAAGYHILQNFNIWMWLLALLGYGRQHLSFNHPALRYATDAVYPFYILHQTVIVILGFQLIYLNWNIGAKFLLVLIGTFAATWAIFAWVIKPFNVLRVPFGMKPKSRRRDEAQSKPASNTSESIAREEDPAVVARANSGSPEDSKKLAGVLVLALGVVLLSQSGCSRGRGEQRVVKLPCPSLESNLMNIPAEQPAVIYLPPSYHDGATRFPVLYLLPNFNHNLWRYTAGSFQGFRIKNAMDEQIRRGMVREMIVVLPNTTHWLGGSWYRNSPLTGSWEDYITQDVVGYVDRNFRTIPAAASRAVAGHGMGGTGALELALKHPDIFGTVYALSPGLFDPNGLHDAGLLAEPWLALWQSKATEWRRTGETARRGFRDFAQARLNSWNRAVNFQGLTISYAAAVAPDPAGPFPHIRFPAPGATRIERAELARQFESLFGNWAGKLAAYRARGRTLNSITIEHGGEGDYGWIRNGAKHLSELMHSMGITNTLAVHAGGHDGDLGRRLKMEMFPTISRTLKGGPGE